MENIIVQRVIEFLNKKRFLRKILLKYLECLIPL